MRIMFPDFLNCESQGSYGFQKGAGERTHSGAHSNLQRKRCNLSMRSRHFRQEVIIEFDAFCCRARAWRGIRVGHWTFLRRCSSRSGTRRATRGKRPRWDGHCNISRSSDVALEPRGPGRKGRREAWGLVVSSPGIPREPLRTAGREERTEWGCSRIVPKMSPLAHTMPFYRRS